MITSQDSRFWQAAIRSGLLDEATLQKSWDAIDPAKRTSEAIDRRLARQTVNSGVLTLWQAQQILAGRWQGLRFDKYELRDVLGQGGMGRVYLARDVRLNRKVALKILSRERMNNERAMARFRREAKVGAQLQHENLVRIYDEGEAHGVRYLVMEYIEGKTVGRLIAELGMLPPLSAADITRKVALGLEHLHQKGLLHRDVNPMNILIDRDGTAKLTDLGLAIDLGDDDEIVTRDGATVGTFDYISPEQAKHSRMVDCRADIYSLGCSLYHMMTGRVPFPTPSLPEKLYAHQLKDPEPIRDFCADVPDGLANVVSRMMRKMPEDRYRRASDVARALEPFATSALSASRIGIGFGVTQEADATTKVSAGSNPAPTGSDPDLGYQQPTEVTAVNGVPEAATGLGFSINLGPEPPLSESRSSAKSRTRSAEMQRWKPPWPRIRRVAVGAALGIALTAGLGYLGYRIWKAKPNQTPISPTQVAGQPKGTAAEKSAVLIRFANGDELPLPSLRDAIKRLSGAGGEIVLRSGATTLDDGTGTALKLADGHLVIRAEEGAKTDLQIHLSRKAPWLEIGSTARLTLVGLSMRVSTAPETAADGSAAAPTVFKAEGNINLEHCSFLATGPDRSLRVLVGRGLENRISACLFDGFDQPLKLTAFSGARMKLNNSILIRHPTSSLAGWAVEIDPGPGSLAKPPSLSLERCTVIGAGLLAADRFGPESPLLVSVANSALQTSSLLMTTIPAEQLTKAIVWTGHDNCYSISSLAWVALAPKAFDGLAGGPTDFKSWTELYPAETGSMATSIKFAGATMSEGQPLAEFAIPTEAGKTPIGADPAQVGPSSR